MNPPAIAHAIRDSLRRLEGFLELSAREVIILREDVQRLTQALEKDEKKIGPE